MADKLGYFFLKFKTAEGDEMTAFYWAYNLRGAKGQLDYEYPGAYAIEGELLKMEDEYDLPDVGDDLPDIWDISDNNSND